MISRFKKKETIYLTFVCVSVVFIIKVNQLTSATSVRPYEIWLLMKLEFPIYCYWAYLPSWLFVPIAFEMWTENSWKFCLHSRWYLRSSEWEQIWLHLLFAL